MANLKVLLTRSWIKQESTSHGMGRAKPLAIQRCRRGGKTFMLHAVASRITNEKGKRLPEETLILFISLNSMTPYSRTARAREPCFLSCLDLHGNSPIGHHLYYF